MPEGAHTAPLVKVAAAEFVRIQVFPHTFLLIQFNICLGLLAHRSP